MWEITISQQIYSILYAFVLGVFFSVIYDIPKSFCVLNRTNNTVVFIKDIIFSLFATLMVFLLLIARSNGVVRGYILFFIFCGFVVFRITLSKYWLKALYCFFNFSYKANKKIKGQFLSVLSKTEQTEAYVIRKLKKILKKVNIIRKNS